MKTNLTHSEWVKSELEWIFYGQNKSSGKLVITESVFSESIRCFSVFSKRKHIFEIRFGLQVYLVKAQGLFNKSANEGVRSNLDRWSWIGRLRLNLGKNRVAAGNAQEPHGGSMDESSPALVEKALGTMVLMQKLNLLTQRANTRFKR